MIQPTTRFGQMRPQRSTVFEVVRGPQGQGPLPGKAKLQTAGGDGDGGLDPSCNSTVTPACLRALYEVGDAYADPDVPTVLGVGGFLEVRF